MAVADFERELRSQVYDTALQVCVDAVDQVYTDGLAWVQGDLSAIQPRQIPLVGLPSAERQRIHDSNGLALGHHSSPRCVANVAQELSVVVRSRNCVARAA